MVRNRFLFREVNDRGFDLPLASVTRDGGVEFRSDLDISVWNPGDDVSHYKRVRPGDFVIGLRSFQSGIGSSQLEGLVSPAYTVLRPTSLLVDGGFFKHLFKSDIFVSRLENVAQGIRQGRTIATEDFYNIEVSVPPPPEQRAIADYLDAETARIDALITKKRRMIDLLLERWRSSVDEITGRGDPVQVRYLTSAITSGPRGWADRVSAKGAPFIRSANLRRDSVNLQLEDLARLTPPVTAESQRSMTSVGDTLVGITGANTGWVGWVNDETSGGYVSQHVAMLRPKDVEPHWLTYSLFAHRSQDQLLGGQYGGTKTQLGLSDLAELKIRLPTAREQRALLDQLDQERKRVNQTRKALPTQLDLLIERRQALITAAVTGELEIPGVAA